MLVQDLGFVTNFTAPYLSYMRTEQDSAAKQISRSRELKPEEKVVDPI
jgi:hypothetical protein